MMSSVLSCGRPSSGTAAIDHDFTLRERPHHRCRNSRAAWTSTPTAAEAVLAISTEDRAMPYYTAIVTLLAVAFYFFLATRVAVAHGKFNVKLPATSGDLDFERIFRVHMNTLEWMPIFLVPLWLCALYLSDIAAAVLGLVWIVGRVLYFAGYSKTVEKRLPGFFVQSTACLLLFIGAVVGIVMRAPGGLPF
jgi:glutathione S-transferase